MLTPTTEATCACGRIFKRLNSMQGICVQCAIRGAKQAGVARRAELKARKERAKRPKDWLAETATALQKLRRFEELKKGRGCMSCSRSQEDVRGTDGWKLGGAWDGGHFVGKGARPELRLEPLNIWLQCKSCNAGSGKYARKAYTVNQSFEANLREQEGDALVEWLKGPHEPRKWTIDELKALKAEFRAKSKALEAE